MNYLRIFIIIIISSSTKYEKQNQRILCKPLRVYRISRKGVDKMPAPKRRGRPRKDATAAKTLAENKAAAKKPTAKKTSEKKPSSAAKKTLKPQGNTVFALDIGTRTVVGVLGYMDGEVFRVTDTESIPHLKRAMIDGQVEDIEQVAKVARTVKEALEQRNGIRLTEVSVAAAGRALKTYRVSMDFDVSDKNTITADMVRTMEYETIQKAQGGIDEKFREEEAVFYCVGHSVVHYYLDDYAMANLEGHKGDKVTIDLIGAFLPEVVVEGLYAVTDKTGLKVKSMTLEPIAAMNVIIPPEIRLINIALVDIGAGTSDIAVARDGAIVAYAMATVAGDEISEDIVRKFFVDFNMAENMKIQASGDTDSITYRDIFGREQTMTKADFFEKCTPSVDSLADVISQTVCDANGQSPAAMFLIGGGSMANGLTDALAKKLGIDPGRVAVGGQEFMKNVDVGGRKLGPEYVTPVGIAVTACTNMAYDFSTVTLNGEQVRVFDTKSLSVFELLGSAGYKTSQIMGHSGAGLKFTLNGETKILKGTAFTPAIITVNGKSAALTTKIKQGDDIILVPAVNGENAHAFIRDYADDLSKAGVIFCGENAVAGKRAYVNGREVDGDYEIQPLDNIEIHDARTLGAFLMQYGGDTETAQVYVNGQVQPESYILKNGDILGFDKGTVASAVPAEETEENIQTAVQPEPAGEQGGFVSIIFNGVPTDLPEKDSKTPYMLIDLFERADIDIENPTRRLVLSVNGGSAKFTDKIQSGDIVVIKQED